MPCARTTYAAAAGRQCSISSRRRSKPSPPNTCAPIHRARGTRITGKTPTARNRCVAMKTFIVGGAVRDRLLGLPVADRDHVVIGATPDDMVALGYQPVGKDFPVFLHPLTHEEYALARTERKTSPGNKGFLFHAAPDVTLEQD